MPDPDWVYFRQVRIGDVVQGQEGPEQVAKVMPNIERNKRSGFLVFKSGREQFYGTLDSVPVIVTKKVLKQAGVI